MCKRSVKQGLLRILLCDYPIIDFDGCGVHPAVARTGHSRDIDLLNQSIW
jgi:hypothetical protein